MSGELTEAQARILQALDDTGGWDTGQVAGTAFPVEYGDQAAIIARKVRRDLLAMHAKGLVKTLDDLKPVCWTRTPAGRAALARYRGETP